MITRKAIDNHAIVVPETMFFCPFDLQQDKVSIHEFVGEANLQADFANAYLGGGVLSGGGSQEESMFVEFTELLVTMFLVEKMHPFEAVEIAGAKKYVEHNMMGARHLERSEQFCRPVDNGPEITTVALDAICFNRHGGVNKNQQYEPTHLLREVRKCLAATGLPTREDLSGRKRNFVTGLWGCGAFRGDMELKCIIQWVCCSIDPSVEKVVFCPWDQHAFLEGKGLLQLVDQLQGKVSVKKVLELLVEDQEYLSARSTFLYLLEKLSKKCQPTG